MTLKGEKVLKKAGVLMGVLLMCSGMVLAREDGGTGKDIDKEFNILVNRGEEGGFLGVLLRDVKAEDVKELGLPGERGVFLVEITKDSPAEKSGLMKGDVIVEYQALPVMSVKQFQIRRREGKLLSSCSGGRKK